MKDVQKQLVKIAAQIYIERLKKWPEVINDTRVTESVKAASQIIMEAKGRTCLVLGGHDFKPVSTSADIFNECTRCGAKA